MKTINAGIYVGPTAAFGDRYHIWDDIGRTLRLRPTALTPVAYTRFRLNRPTVAGKRVFTTAADRNSMNAKPADLIILSHAIERPTQVFYDSVIDQIHEIRRAYQGVPVALHLNIPQSPASQKIRCNFAFNARAAGAILVYAETPEAKAARDNAPDVTFKNLLDIVLSAQSGPLVTPDFAVVPQSNDVRLGDVWITRKISTRGSQSAIVHDARDESLIKDFTGAEALTLFNLAVLQGSYLAPEPESPSASYYQANKLSAKLRKLGFGKLRSIKGVGLYVDSADFSINRAPKGPFARTQYPFAYSPEQRLLTWDSREVVITASEGIILQEMMKADGKPVDKTGLFPTKSARYFDVYLHKLRLNFDHLAPVGTSAGQELFETIYGVGARMTPAPEFAERYKAIVQRASAARSSHSLPRPR